MISITSLGQMVHLGPLQPIWEGFAPTLGLTIFISLLPTVLMIIFRTFFTLKADAPWHLQCLLGHYGVLRNVVQVFVLILNYYN